MYAAALGIIATITGAGTTWGIMCYWELAAFDRRLSTDAQELFRDVEHFEGGSASNRSAFKEIFVPRALRDRFIQVTVIAAAAAIFHQSAVVRTAIWLAAAGLVVSPVLLILDLGRPRLFINMLRVFKRSRPCPWAYEFLPSSAALRFRR